MPPLRPFLFLLLIAGLGTLALVSLRTPARIVTGLPQDPDVARARDLVHDRIAVSVGGLRFRSELIGEIGRGDLADSTAADRRTPALAALAEHHLLAARSRHPLDARLPAALGSLDLARLRFERAERLYREAIDLAPACGEARLGLGVALAVEAEIEGDIERSRGLRMRAMSQLLAVPGGAPEYPAALYDQAILLLRSGTKAEATRRGAEYWRLDSTSEWASRLRRELASAGS
jgi:hypothetical protein